MSRHFSFLNKFDVVERFGQTPDTFIAIDKDRKILGQYTGNQLATGVAVLPENTAAVFTDPVTWKNLRDDMPAVVGGLYDGISEALKDETIQ